MYFKKFAGCPTNKDFCHRYSYYSNEVIDTDLNDRKVVVFSPSSIEICGFYKVK